MNGEENILLMKFFNDDPIFTLGFEAGTIYTKVESGETLIDYLFHYKNIKQVKEIMKTFLSGYKIEKVNEEWAKLTMDKITI
jgi:hypothetical protein